MPTHKKLAIRVQNSRLFGMTFQNTKTPQGMYPEEFLCISEDVAKRSNICFLSYLSYLNNCSQLYTRKKYGRTKSALPA